jgi:glycosyltransferase involved in cell wall biosynthesis
VTRFSLIVPTINRTAELERLLTSIVEQDQEADVVIVDQNADDRVARIVELFAKKLRIVHTSSATGAARARNIGLDLAQEELIAFPDDDCWYPCGLLREVAHRFNSSAKMSGLCVRCADEYERDAGIRWLRRPATLDRFNIWRGCIEASTFIRRSAISDLRFNGELGQGSGTAWGSGEITDLVLRIIARGHEFRYEPRLIVHHRSHLVTPLPEEKVLRYARGTGMVLRLNDYGPVAAALLCLRPMARAVARASCLDFAGASLAQKVAAHRWRGYRGIA